MRLATIRDVALRAGVSAGTVSNVLNRPSYVAEETRRRVLDAIEELGFVPTSSARQYREGRSRTIGMLVETMSNPFFVDLALGAEEATRNNNSAFIILDSSDDVRQERINLEIAVQQRVQGVLISPVEEDNRLLDSYVRYGIPVVFLDRIRSRQSRCSVSVDQIKGGCMAIEHLRSLGHVRVGFVGGPTGFRQVADRLRAATDAANAHDIAIEHIPTHGLTVQDGARAGRRLAALPPSLRPTGVLCANDLIAMGLLQECRHQGIVVPDELSIVGYDNLDLAAGAAVPLTTISQPRHEMGAVAARLLLDEIDSTQHAHQQVVLNPELVIRGSTAKRVPAAVD